MRKIPGIIISVGLIGVLLSTTSCKDDPPIKPKLSFSESTVAYNEADDVIEISVSLDRPALEDFTINYTVSGTAQDEETASNNTDDPDYKILDDLSDYGEIDVKKGETTGVVQIQLYSDFTFEDAETIILKIQDTDSELIEITRDDDIEITVDQEDGLIIVLDWAENAVDLDLLVRYGTSTSNWSGVITGSLFKHPEIAFIPNSMDDGAFGLSYTYYEGTVDPLNFTVDFIDYINGAVEPEANWTSFGAAYTQANVNAWDNVSSTQVVQTFTKAGSNWSNFSAITVPASGSRVGIQSIPSEPIKIQGIIGPKSLKHY